MRGGVPDVGSARNPEPLVTVGGITTLVTAVLALVVAFVPSALTEDQQSAILGVAAVVGPAVVAIVARHWVSPAYKVGDAWAEGYQEAGRDASAGSTRPGDVAKSGPEIDTSDGSMSESLSHPTDVPGVGHDGVPDVPRRAIEEER